MGVFKSGFVRLPKQEATTKMAQASVSERTPWGQVEFEERKEAPLFKFNRTGDALQGVLIKMEPVSIKDEKTGAMSKTIAYFFSTDTNGGVQKIHGTWEINQKLSPGDLGRVVRVIFRGLNKEVGTAKGNALRNFDVLVDRKLAKQNDLVITDADIPF